MTLREFDIEMKRLQRSNALASQSLYPMKGRHLRQQIFTQSAILNSMLSQYKEDMKSCVTVSGIVSHLNTVEVRNLTMPDQSKISWVSVRGMHVYRRVSAMHNTVDVSSGMQVHQTDQETCLLYFPARCNETQAHAVTMHEYTGRTCTTQYMRYFATSPEGTQLTGTHYPHGGFDILVVKLGDTQDAYDIMLISKPLP